MTPTQMVMAGITAFVLLGGFMLAISKWIVGEIRKNAEERVSGLKERIDAKDEELRRSEQRIRELETKKAALEHRNADLEDRLLGSGGGPRAARVAPGASSAGTVGPQIRVEEYQEAELAEAVIATAEKERS